MDKRTKVVNGKTYVLYAGRWHIQAKADRLVVSGYPYSHNPYIAHAPVADCYAGCVRQEAK